ncbi:hypothetical protein ACSCBZ_42380 [Streptomyces niveiscabiei]|uniref:hypothetical protein n=1 Tax=Streptomyces niveiscabiei TaxID=164115 RepID=UPI0006EBA89D|nr:hypothetical protein [Streptomyces niveiscabiei]
MPLRAESLPGNPRALWEAVRQLQRAVRELRASRSLEHASLSSGSLSVLGSAEQSLRLVPVSPTGVTLPDGSVVYPPAVAFLSGSGDIAAGALTAYRKPTAAGSVPVVLLLSPQAGTATAGLTLQGGETGGEAALATLAAGGAALTLSTAGIAVSGVPGNGWAEDAVTTTNTSTTYADALSGVFSATCTVPPTGRVTVTIRCTQRATGTLNALTSWRATGTASGIRYAENDDAALVVPGANNLSLSLRHPLTGLAPGETLTVKTLHRLNSATTQTIAYRSILLEPNLT